MSYPPPPPPPGPGPGGPGGPVPPPQPSPGFPAPFPASPTPGPPPPPQHTAPPPAPTPYPGAPGPVPPPGAYQPPPGATPPPGPPGGPPPGGNPPPGYPGAPPPAPKKKGKGGLIAGLGLVALVVVAALVVGLVVVLGDDDPGPMRRGSSEMAEMAQGRAEVTAAVATGDVEAIPGLVDDADGLADEATTATLGEPVTAPLEGGLAVVTFDATAGQGYTVTADGGGGVLASAVVPPEADTALAPADVVDATADGAHLLLLAPEGDATGEVTVTVAPIEVVDVDLSVGEPIDGEIAEPGQAVEYEVAAEAGEHYLVDLDNTDLTLTVLAPDGSTVATEPDIDLDIPRFVAEQSGPYRLRVSGGMGGATGSFAIEVTLVAEFYFFYGEEGDDLYLPATVEQNFQVPISDEDSRGHFCVFLREGVSIDLDIRVTTATLDLGIDIFDETDSGDLIARINEFEAGQSELWAVTARQDTVRCIQLWADNYSSGNFVVSFTTSS